jgi:hypothetical protein
MHGFDGIHETLAIVVGAKNHVVEVIRSHHFLAAPVRRSKEKKSKKRYVRWDGQSCPSLMSGYSWD